MFPSLGGSALGSGGNVAGATLFMYPVAYFAKKSDKTKQSEKLGKDEAAAPTKKKKDVAKKEPETPATGRKTRKSKV